MTDTESEGPFARFDARLFHAWQAGDPSAREAAWRMMWRTHYSRAYRYCRCFTHDEQSAEHDAATAITDAWLRIERWIGSARWSGEAEFEGLVISRVMYGCREVRDARLGGGRRIADWLDALDDDPGSRLEVLASVRAYRDEATARRDLDDLLRSLGILRELSRTREKPAETVEAIIRWVRNCLVATLSPDLGCRGMSLDDLAARIDPRAPSFPPGEMSAFVMRELGISRNTYDQRVRQLRKLLHRA